MGAGELFLVPKGAGQEIKVPEIEGVPFLVKGKVEKKEVAKRVTYGVYETDYEQNYLYCIHST